MQMQQRLKGSSAEAAEIDRFISKSSRLMFGDSPARSSESAEVFNESVRDLDPAGASDSSSDWEWEALVQGMPAEDREWEALVQGLPRMQMCSSCHDSKRLEDFKGLKQGGLKLFKTCNGCRKKKQRPKKQRPGPPNVTAAERRELERPLQRKLPEHAITDFDESDFDAVAKHYDDSDSSGFETFYVASDYETHQIMMIQAQD